MGAYDSFYDADLREMTQCSRAITVQTRNNYGTQAIYPICDEAKVFAAMLGQKTLTPDNIQYIMRLGFEVFNEPVAPVQFKLNNGV